MKSNGGCGKEAKSGTAGGKCQASIGVSARATRGR